MAIGLSWIRLVVSKVDTGIHPDTDPWRNKEIRLEVYIHIGGLFKAYSHAGGPGGMRSYYPLQSRCRCTSEDTDRVVLEVVVHHLVELGYMKCREWRPPRASFLAIDCLSNTQTTHILGADNVVSDLIVETVPEANGVPGHVQHRTD